MSDVKPTPSAPAKNEPSLTPNQPATISNSHVEDGGESKGGSRRRDGRGENNRFQANADDHSDSGSINRKGKRPEVQHYKPPGASKKSDENQGLTQDFDSNSPETSKAGNSSRGVGRGRGRGRRGGHNYHNQGHNYNSYNTHHEDMDDSTRKMKQMTLQNEYNKYNENVDNSSYKGGTGGRRKKKPEQLHYIPKKPPPTNETLSSSLEPRSGNDGNLTEDKRNHEKGDNHALDAKSEDNSYKKEYPNKDGNLSKDERYGSTKRTRNKGNKKEYRKESKDNFDYRHQERGDDKRDHATKPNYHSNKESNFRPKENGYVDDVSESMHSHDTKDGGKDSSRKGSSGHVGRSSENDPNLPPRLRGVDKQEKFHATESADRGGRAGNKFAKGGYGKGGKPSGKHSRGHSPQGENSVAKNDSHNAFNKGNYPKPGQNTTKDDFSHKLRDIEP